MTGPKQRRTPRDWCAEQPWPTGPFRPPEDRRHDLVTVEQLAMLVQEIEARYGREGRTQAELEDAADIGRAELSRLINGHNFPNLDTLCRLAAAMGYRLTLTEWTVAGRGEPQPGDMPERVVWSERVQQPAAIEDAYAHRRKMPPRPTRGRLRRKSGNSD
jgi:transcriptional regulator with XRE-family HTH domain